MAENVTRLVEQAFNEVSKLPADEQDSFAHWMLEELSEREWQKRYAATRDALRQKAREARRDRKEGRTEELDPDKL